MTENRNDTEQFAPTSEQLEALFNRSGELAMAEQETRRKASAWPSDVERVLGTLAKRSASQAEALAAIHDRLSALEAAMGIG